MHWCHNPLNPFHAHRLEMGIMEYNTVQKLLLIATGLHNKNKTASSIYGNKQSDKIVMTSISPLQLKKTRTTQIKQPSPAFTKITNNMKNFNKSNIPLRY